MTKFCSILAAMLLFIGFSTRSMAEACVVSTITSIYPVGSGYFVLYFQSGTSCTGGFATVAVGSNGVTADGAHMLLSVALTAFSMSKTVELAYDETNSNCYVN